MRYQKDIEEKQGYQNVEINERNYQGWEKIRVKQKSKEDQHCDWDDQNRRRSGRLEALSRITVCGSINQW